LALTVQIDAGLAALDVFHEVQLEDVVVVEIGDWLAVFPIHFDDYIIIRAGW
jgi:hypothetical protein